MVSIPACHAGDRGSIPRRGGFILPLSRTMQIFKYKMNAQKVQNLAFEYIVLRNR